VEYRPKVSDPRSKATGAAQLAELKVDTSGDVFGISFHKTLAKSIEEIQVRLKEHNCLLDLLKEGGKR